MNKYHIYFSLSVQSYRIMHKNKILTLKQANRLLTIIARMVNVTLPDSVQPERDLFSFILVSCKIPSDCVPYIDFIDIDNNLHVDIHFSNHLVPFEHP